MPGKRLTPEDLERVAQLPPPLPGATVVLTNFQLSHIRASDGCWHWTGTIDRDGYGHASGWRLAHRLAYQYWVGEIPDDHHVDHACHNSDPSCTNGSTCMHRRCVRPDHLAARVASENLADQYPTRRTHCKNGHELTTENTIRRRKGARTFRTCRTCSAPERRECPVKADTGVGPRVQETQLHATDAGTREVPLKGGLVALIDEADWPLVKTFSWYPRVDREHFVYARGIRRVNGKAEWVVMHRLLMQPPRGTPVYHRNHHGLDNRRSNLQVGAGGSDAVRGGRRNKFGLKGVTWNAQRGRWRATIRAGGRVHSLGQFASQEEAAQAYRDALDRFAVNGNQQSA